MDKICVAVDLGGTSVKMGFFSQKGELLDKWEIPTRKEEAGSHILPDIATSILKELSLRGIEKEAVIGIGIGVPGPVVLEKEVLQCVNLGWGHVAVAEELIKLTGIPIVKVANDANVAALGEMWMGGGKGFMSIVMVTLGTGVGGGIIINGEILSGSNGAAGEIGHITINLEEADACNCGKKGCLEQYASATGIVKEAKRALLASDEPSSLRSFSSLSAKSIFDEAKAGDSLALKMVDQLAKNLGIALAHVAHTVDPEAFVIGGGVSKAGNILTKNIETYYNTYSMDALKNKTFTLATLGNDAGIYGSAKLIGANLFDE
ncbi:MAG: glucokinase [Clostridiales bacterium]|nr:glucokinase [Clostridiales bacterium]